METGSQIPPNIIEQEERKLNVQNGIQSVDDIQVIKSDTDEAVVSIFAEEDEDPVAKVKEQLKRENWWLNDHWQKKGMPREQFTIKIGEQEVQLYSWLGDLSEKQQSDTRDAIDKLANQTKFGFFGIDYILIDDEDKKHPYGAENQLIRGESKGQLKSFILYPEGIKERPYRNGELNNCSELEGILVHEIGHRYEQWWQQGHEMIINLWMKDFGEGFPSQKVKDRDQAVTSYGKLNTSDDFSECLVAAFYDPDKLEAVSPAKSEFIKEYVLIPEVSGSGVTIEKMLKINLPRLPDTLTYNIRPSGITIKK